MTAFSTARHRRRGLVGWIKLPFFSLFFFTNGDILYFSIYFLLLLTLSSSRDGVSQTVCHINRQTQTENSPFFFCALVLYVVQFLSFSFSLH
jgi:hypothetical protein